MVESDPIFQPYITVEMRRDGDFLDEVTTELVDFCFREDSEAEEYAKAAGKLLTAIGPDIKHFIEALVYNEGAEGYEPWFEAIVVKASA